MPSLLWIEGRTGRAAYLKWSLAWLLSQYLASALLLAALGGPKTLEAMLWHTLVVPLRYVGLAIQGPRSYVATSLLTAGFLYQIVVAWALAALALRRARDAGINEWWATAAFIPPLQPLLVLFLSLPPSLAAPSSPPQAAPTARAGVSIEAFKGACVGIGLTVIAVAMSALVFGVYGYGLFVLSPVVISGITAYLANRRGDIGAKATWALVRSAAALGGLALLSFALEGLICIVVIAPLWVAGAAIGGPIGRAIALSGRHPPRNAAAALILLPLVYGLEAGFPAPVTFRNEVSIEIKAPPAAVWRAITAMGRVEERPGLLFRWGLAHPLSGRLLGTGIGAKRHGVFSTGTAIERITHWDPDRRLAFVVLTDVPTVRELSPYEHVHAPHAVGYFRTLLASFELEDRGERGTRLTLTSTHLLRLEPAPYWLPFVTWVIEQNKARVLRHIRALAEHGS